MAERHIVTCVTREDQHDPHSRITHIGGPWGMMTLEAALKGLHEGSLQLYAKVMGKEIAVVADKSTRGHDFIRTVYTDLAAPADTAEGHAAGVGDRVGGAERQRAGFDIGRAAVILHGGQRDVAGTAA